jgi:hypothetical protein
LKLGKIDFLRAFTRLRRQSARFLPEKSAE